MTMTITMSDLDTLTRLHRDASEMAAKLRGEHADHVSRALILEAQIRKLDAVITSLGFTARDLELAKPDALLVVRGRS